MAATDCQLETLISSNTCEVQYCDDCGLFHLTMGPLTLRLNEAHFNDLANDLGMAAAQQKHHKSLKMGRKKAKVTSLHS